MRVHHQISWSLSLNLVLPTYHGTIVIPQIAVHFGPPLYHGIIGIPKSPFISAYQTITELFLSRSLFISACLCIMASSVFPYHCLFRFCQNITASVFIPYRRISRYCRIWCFGYLSWLHSYFSFRTFISSPSWLDEQNDTLVSSLCWFGKRNDTLAHHISILAQWAKPYLHLVSILVRWTEWLISS